ncbi:MAG: hypothetical protein J1E05_00350 [Eubacterium sp.]|nr:hypothetical protein [Eubacterium sp.]
MASEIKEKFKGFLQSKQNKTKLLFVAGIVGILMILLSEISFTTDKKKPETEVTSISYSDYVNELDDKLTDLISSIDGVGKCKVMITLKNTTESVFAKNTQNNQTESSYSQNDEYVIYDGENGDSPILLKEIFPQIEGVAVVCSGGDNIVVKEKIIQCVSSLFNISSNRISVSKISADY